LFRHRNAWQLRSCPSLQKIHGPLRSNKAGDSVTKSGCSSRQVVEIFGGASRDRTDDLIVANDALSQLSYSPTSGEIGNAILAAFSGKTKQSAQCLSEGTRPETCLPGAIFNV
jgi:hypothetical protein